MSEEMDTVTVLFLAGAGRSGSTLLSNVLGEVDGLFAGGELRYLWERGIDEGRRCGCGEPVTSCPVWSAVVDRAFGGVDGADVAGTRALQARTTRIRHLPQLLLAPVSGRRFAADLAAYRDRLGRLYQAVAAVTGARVVVDASKLPTFGRVLDGAPGIDLKVVHLVRDARATAFSWGRRKALTDRDGFMEQQSPLKAAALWTTWNAVTELSWAHDRDRYLRIRYEDLVAEPEASLRAILTLVGTEDATLPLTPEGVRLGPNHGVAGNPDRMRHGVVPLRPDVEWQQRMRRRDRAAVLAVAAPLLWRYGYVGNGAG